MKRFRTYFRISKKEMLLSLLAVTVLAVSVPVITYMYFAKNLTSKQAIMNKNDTGLILLDRDGKPFFTFYAATYKSFVPLNSMPPHVSQSIIASEDKDFYRHPGFSVPSMIRALYINTINHDHLYGGSTITQQLVKNALLNSNKTYLRKVQEIVLAQEIERRYSKQEILEMYLNFVYFGEDAFGIENASLTYFGKHAKDLSVAESAFLTALLPSPSRLSPFSGDIHGAKLRQQNILQKMYEQRYLTQEQYEKAKKQKLVFQPTERQINEFAPHFALMVRDELIKKYGEERLARSGFRVKTTLDRNLQIHAESAVRKQVEKLSGNNVSNGAAVVMDPKTGEILALVGSADWYNANNGKINLATTPRSVGSSFKPIVYAAGLEQHLITPATTLMDNPTTFPGDYRPLNYDRTFRGPVPVRKALANSLNVPAVQVMQKVGLYEALAMAKRLGITTLSDPSQYGLSLVLGTGEVKLIELTNVYATFAAQGMKPTPTLIAAVTDKNGRPLYKSKVQTEQVLSPASAFLISSILSDADARSEAFGNLLDISRTAAVKTGTAEDYKDALTVGYSPSIVVGVWVGNNDNQPMDSIAGSLGAAPIWKELMEYTLKNTAYEPFKAPSTIISASVCGSGTAGTNTEYFINGTQQTIDCQWFAPRDNLPTIQPDGLSTVREWQRFRRNMRHQLRQQVQQEVPEAVEETPHETTPAISPPPNT